MKYSNDNWIGFKGDVWRDEINVRDFIQSNYTPYEGDESFLVSSSEKTRKVWNKLTEMFKEERERGVYDAETKLPQTITTYGPGYIDKDNEVVVGLQTDAPLKRGIFPKGGIRMVENSLNAYGYELDPMTKEIFTKYRKTHNEGVFSAYTEEMLEARRSAIITGLPDAYGRGRIIGDYRRVALYGTAILIAEKKHFQKRLDIQEITEETIRSREEVSEQIKALKDFEKMCAGYGFDVTTRHVFGNRHAGVVARGYGHAVEELVERDDVAGLEEHGRAACACGIAAHLHFFLVAGLTCADGLHGRVHGKHLGQGGGRDAPVGILLIQDAPGGHVHENGASGVDRACRSRKSEEQAEKAGESGAESRAEAADRHGMFQNIQDSQKRESAQRGGRRSRKRKQKPEKFLVHFSEWGKPAIVTAPAYEKRRTGEPDRRSAIRLRAF